MGYDEFEKTLLREGVEEVSSTFRAYPAERLSADRLSPTGLVRDRERVCFQVLTSRGDRLTSVFILILTGGILDDLIRRLYSFCVFVR